MAREVITRPRRTALVVIAIAALVAVAAVVILRRSAMPGAVRTAAEARLAAALGQPVTIGEIGLVLVPRVAFTGSSVRVGAAGGDAPGVSLDRVRIVPRLRSLLGSTIAIEEVRLEGLTVSLLRDGQGRWHAPAAFPAPTGGEPVSVAIDRVSVWGGRIRIFDGADGRARQTSSIDAINAEMRVERGGLRLAPLGGRVGGARIDGEAIASPGAITLTFNAPAVADADLQALFGLLGAARPATVRLDRPGATSVTVRIDRTTSRLTGKGTLRIPALVVEPLRLQDVEAPFTIAGSQLTFEPITFTVNAGAHRGRVLLSLDSEPARWSADSRVERLDVGGLLDTLAGRDARIDGTGQLDVVLRGRVEADFVRGMEGGAHLWIADGVIREFPLLASVNRALRLAEAESNDTRFERLRATLDVGSGSAATNDLVIDAEHLRFELAGRMDFGGALALRGRAIVSAERAAAAVASVHELARIRNASGEIAVPLTIGGTFDAPRFGVDVERALREGARDELLRRLRGLIRRSPENRQ